MWPERFPVAVTGSATVLILVLAVFRIVLVRGTSQAERLVNLHAMVMGIGVFLREPVVARHLARFVPGGLSTIFDVFHWTMVVTWVIGLGLCLLSAVGAARYRARYRAAPTALSKHSPSPITHVTTMVQ